MWGALSDLCRQDVLGWTASLTFPPVQIRKREENDRRTGTQPVGLKQCQQNFPFNLFNYKTLFVQLHLPQPQVAYLVSSTGHLTVQQHILIFMLHKLTWDCNNKEVSWNWEFSAETPNWHLGHQLRASSIILEANCHFLTHYHTWTESCLYSLSRCKPTANLFYSPKKCFVQRWYSPWVLPKLRLQICFQEFVPHFAQPLRWEELEPTKRSDWKSGSSS